MYVNKTKFERNSSQQYYHMPCIGKKKHTYKQKRCIGTQLPDADSNLDKLPFPLILSQYFEPPRDVTAAMLVVK